MAQDLFTVTTSKGWFGRIGESIKGILFGMLLIVISFPVLFMNEGRTVKTRKTLDEGAKSVLSVSSDTVSPANEGKIVHLTGKTAADGALTDPEFGVSAEFTLSDSLVGQINNFTSLSGGLVEMPDEIAGKKAHRAEGGFYLGADPAAPVVGDLRIRHEARV
jgi:hypothetical protein